MNFLIRVRAALRPKSYLNHNPDAEALAQAEAQRWADIAVYKATQRRRDTRGIHTAERKAKVATLIELEVAVGRAPSAWRGR